MTHINITSFLDSFLWFVDFRLSISFDPWEIPCCWFSSPFLRIEYLISWYQSQISSFIPFCLDSLPENPWRLFVNHLHRCCHQRALLEIVLIVGVCNGYVKAYWIPNSCRHSFRCVDFVLTSLHLSVIYPTSILLLLLLFPHLYRWLHPLVPRPFLLCISGQLNKPMANGWHVASLVTLRSVPRPRLVYAF